MTVTNCRGFEAAVYRDKKPVIMLNFDRTYLDQDVVRAVISVPAYFGELQRQETMEAGSLVPGRKNSGEVLCIYRPHWKRGG